MKPILDMFPEKSIWPMLLLGAALAGTETGLLPTPRANVLHELDKRIITTELMLAQAKDEDGELDTEIEKLGDQVDDNTKVLHSIEVNQGRLDEKLDSLSNNLSRDLQRLFNSIDRQENRRSRPVPHRLEDNP